MPALDSLRVSPNFTRAELGYDRAPAAAQEQLEALARLLERVRVAVRVPLRITSGYRSPAANAAIPGASPTSQHTTGQAADFIPVGITVTVFLQRLAAARLSGFGQLIVYPVGNNHVHISLPSLRSQDSVLVNNAAEGMTPAYSTVALADSAARVARMRGEQLEDSTGRAPGSSIGGAVVVLLALLGFYLWRR